MQGGGPPRPPGGPYGGPPNGNPGGYGPPRGMWGGPGRGGETKDGVANCWFVGVKHILPRHLKAANRWQCCRLTGLERRGNRPGSPIFCCAVHYCLLSRGGEGRQQPHLCHPDCCCGRAVLACFFIVNAQQPMCCWVQVPRADMQSRARESIAVIPADPLPPSRMPHLLRRLLSSVGHVEAIHDDQKLWSTTCVCIWYILVYLWLKCSTRQN